MDFKFEEIQKIVPDLFILCEDIQKQMFSLPNKLHQIKKQIKQYLLENGIQKKLSSEKRSTIDQQSLNNIQLHQSQSSRSSVKHLSQLLNSSKKAESTNDLDSSISKESSQSNQISTDLQNMMFKLLSELQPSEVILQKIIKNYSDDPTVYLGQSNPVILHFEVLIYQIQEVKQSLADTNQTKLFKCFDELYNYYQEERSKAENVFIKILSEDKIDIQNNNQIEQAIQQLQECELLQITAPFIESQIVTQQNFQKFLTQNSSYEIQRIGIELIQPCQKNLIIYLINRFLSNNNIKPSIVIKVKELLKDKKTYTYYQITPNNHLEQLINIEEYSFDQENSMFVREGNSENKIKLEQFISHILSCIFTLPLENFFPNYAVNQEGDLFRVFNHIQSKDGKIQHSGKTLTFYIFSFYSQRQKHIKLNQKFINAQQIKKISVKI